MLSFIHAGDVHLGNPMSGLSRNLPNNWQEAVQSAGYQAFDKLIDAAVNQRVDFVLFPGDLLNGAGQSAKVQATLLRGFLKLQKAGVQVVLSFGNHDYEAFSEASLAWPENVHVFGHEVEEIVLKAKDGQRVAFVGFSYADRAERRDRLADFPNKGANVDYAIGLYHGMQGKPGDDYAAFSLDAMLKKGYDYWALGHIHQRAVLHEEPTIAYSGNLQGLNRKETGAKGAYLVKEEGGRLLSTFLDLAPLRFEEKVLDNPSGLLDLLKELQGTSFEQPTLLSLRLQGSIGEELRLAAAQGDLLEKVQQAFLGSTDFWPIHFFVEEKVSVSKPAFAAIDFDEAIEQTVGTESLLNLLSDEVPLAIREYFSEEEGQAAVTLKLRQLFEQGEGSDEN
ncbi:metallophosphoesterase family protein [Fructobacillus papyrifericola]|uniref:DNA repair exonuclease n=1 Tax=Fructobacillus papyrifericola TaxID=2713172 RepID=A0ABS5QRR5_9LACO|nr:DNA repair exonuclease [Fructobacillus papyrifericola]MBS9335886.1 DNA repair exonuclease [Fructobacillus papyrifericola]